MDYYKNVRILEDKLSGVLADENMLLRVNSRIYPYTINIVQDQSPEAQMYLYSTTDGNTSSHDSAIRLMFQLDGLVIRTDSRVIVSDSLMNKIKGLSKKLHYAFLQAYFAWMTTEGHAASEDDFVGDDSDSDSGEQHRDPDTDFGELFCDDDSD